MTRVGNSRQPADLGVKWPFTRLPQSAHMDPMDIFQIWARESDSPTASKWLIDAWDDDSIAGNHEGYSEALAKHREEHGADNVAVIVQAVNMDLIEAAFQPTRIPTEPDAARWKQMYINEAACHDAASRDRAIVARVLSSIRRLALESDATVDREDILKQLKALDDAIGTEISTAEQRDALPVGSALLDPQGVCVKYYGHWARPNAVGEWNPTLPAILIHRGDGPILTPEAHT